MTVYLLNLFSVPCYAFLFQYVVRSDRKRRFFLCLVVGLQLFVTAAFRDVSVGRDLENYIPAYEYISGASWAELFFVPFEKGYVFLNKLLSFITLEIRLLLILISGFVVWGYIRFIYRNSSMPWLSLFLFVAMGFFTESLSMLRQAVAMVIVLSGLEYIEKRHFGKYLSVVMLAMTFHLTAVIALILYPFFRLKLNFRNFVLIVTGCGLFMLAIGRGVLNFFIANFYSLYASNVQSGSGWSMLLLLLVIAAGGMLPYSSGRPRGVCMSMIVLASCMQLFALQFALFARIVMYFSMALIVCIPEALSRLQDRQMRLIMTLTVCVLAVMYFVFLILGRNAAGIVPYRLM